MPFPDRDDVYRELEDDARDLAESLPIDDEIDEPEPPAP